MKMNMSKELFEIALIQNGIQPFDIPLDLKKATKQQLRELINNLYGTVVDLLETQILREVDHRIFEDPDHVYYPFAKELGLNDEEDDEDY